jgi:thioredoxin reductase (NADPH)
VIELTLYSRAYCHLCHDMQAQVEALGPEFGLQLTVLDVDADAALEARFNELVPVLMHGEIELARYRLEAEALRAYLAKIR